MATNELTLRSLARLVRTGAACSRDVVSAHLDSLRRWNAMSNAACFINEAESLARADALDARIKQGEKQGLLAGIPFTAKDHIRLVGTPRSMGTTFRSTGASDRSDPLMTAALNQGGICVAKGNQTEYGKAFFTENERFGKTVHFLDPSRTPGGSGGGDAVIVAVGGAVFGLGVDASGSVRVPASFCGLYGLVPTHGLLPQSGLVEDAHCFSSTFSVPGIMTRGLEDLEIVFSALRVFDRSYPYATAYPMGLHPDPVGAPVRRIGVLRTVKDIPIESEISSALDAVTQRCADAGFSADTFSSSLFEKTVEPFIVLNVQAVIAAEDLLYAELGTPRTSQDDGPRLTALREKIRHRLPPLTVEGLLTMLNRVEQLRRAAASLFEQVDLLIAPVAAITAPHHGVDRFSVGGRDIESQDAFLFTAMTNVLGLPSLAFPTHRGNNGMPVGLQVIGPRFSELRMFALLHQLGYYGPLQLLPSA